MHPLRSLPSRKHVITTEDIPYRGHDLARISERLPGLEPTNSPINLTDGPTYESRYWRCLSCGQERNRRGEFTTQCAVTLATVADGGYSIEDDRTVLALAEDMTIEPDGTSYAVRSEAGVTHRVDLAVRTCTCSDNRDHRAFCKHLRRVDIEMRTGTVPDVDD